MSNILEISPDDEIGRKYSVLPKELAAQLIDARKAELVKEKLAIEREMDTHKSRLDVLRESKDCIVFLKDAGASGCRASVSDSVSGPLRAHKFLSFLSNSDMIRDQSIKRMFDYIESAEKFSFYSAVRGDNFDYLSDFGKDLFSAGIARLPHEKVYFEIGVRIADRDIVCAMFGGTDTPEMWFYISRDYGRSWAPAGAIDRNTGKPASGWEQEEMISSITKSLGDIFYACIALLASTSVIVTDEIVSASANRKRIESGKVPLHSHRIVTINHTTTVMGIGTIGTHASPRLHWRRGHVRRYRSGVERWIAPTLVGCAERGIVTHDYRVN